MGSAAVSNKGEMWYYMNGGNRVGPVDKMKLASMLASGELDGETRVWKKGMEKWVAASSTDLMNGSGEQAQPSVVNFTAADGGEDKPKGKKSRKWIWIVLALVVLAAAAAVYFLFLAPGQKAAAAEETPPEATVPSYILEEYVVFENEECAFIIDTIGEKGDYLELDVRCINKISDVLRFSWESTCLNGSMFDPLWYVYVQGNSTMKSSITFPLDALGNYELLPAEELKFILSIYNNGAYDKIRMESSKYIVFHENVWDLKANAVPRGYKRIEGYDDYLFSSKVKVDDDGRPYYEVKDKPNVYFDEIYDYNGERLYADVPDPSYYVGFYEDPLGRPYYFNNSGDTLYYDGYGYGFQDAETGKYYFYDQSGRLANYANGGIPEYYEGTVSKEQLEAGKTDEMKNASGCHVLHEEFTIYPTGKTMEDMEYPPRVISNTEEIIWKGEKGDFVILGGRQDEFKGYIVHLYIENKSENYVCFRWNDVVVNGCAAKPDTVTILRPGSNCYREVLLTNNFLESNGIGAVEEINCRVNVVGENLSIPLYPMTWNAETLALVKK